MRQPTFVPPTAAMLEEKKPVVLNFKTSVAARKRKEQYLAYRESLKSSINLPRIPEDQHAEDLGHVFFCVDFTKIARQVVVSATPKDFKEAAQKLKELQEQEKKEKENDWFASLFDDDDDEDSPDLTELSDDDSSNDSSHDSSRSGRSRRRSSKKKNKKSSSSWNLSSVLKKLSSPRKGRTLWSITKEGSIVEC
jgi:hypothetical protein